MRLFFVMGAPKSGTTWLQTIMNCHPQVSCFGEGHFIDQVALPMQQVMQHYNRQLAVVSALVYNGQPHYAPLSQPDIAGLIRGTMLSLMRRAGPSPQALWWGDKTPGYSAYWGMLNELFPACRFIDVLRDPRDVAVSVLYHASRSGMLHDVKGDQDKRREIIVHAVQRWLTHVGDMERAAAQLGDRLLQVSYHALVETPEIVFRRLFGHLEGIAVTDEIINHVMAASSFESMSGGRERGDTDDTSFFRSGTHGQHRTELTQEESGFIRDRLGPVMRRHGLPD